MRYRVSVFEHSRCGFAAPADTLTQRPEGGKTLRRSAARAHDLELDGVARLTLHEVPHGGGAQHGVHGLFDVAPDVPLRTGGGQDALGGVLDTVEGRTVPLERGDDLGEGDLRRGAGEGVAPLGAA